MVMKKMLRHLLVYMDNIVNTASYIKNHLDTIWLKVITKMGPLYVP